MSALKLRPPVPNLASGAEAPYIFGFTPGLKPRPPREQLTFLARGTRMLRHSLAEEGYICELAGKSAQLVCALGGASKLLGIELCFEGREIFIAAVVAGQ